MIRSVRRGGAALGATLLAVLVTAAPARADAERDKQWYAAPMKLAQARELGHGGAGVIVAVIDTGVDHDHQDLRGALVPGRNMTLDVPEEGIDPEGHGTGMAALIAGRGHGSGDGLLGVAPRSRVMPITPINDALMVSRGIKWAVDHGAKVINMSFELNDDRVIQSAVNDAVKADVVVIGGVGNDHGPVAEPAILDNVLGVGAVDRNNKVTDFSNFGPGVDLVAPGVQIPAARPGNRYELRKGTSDASALVSGAAALIRARYPDMSAAEVIDRLTRTADDRGAKGRNDNYGYGQLDVVAALTAPRVPVKAATTAPPVVDTPVSSAPLPAARMGIPPLLIVGAGLLLLVVAFASFMIIRVRRNT